jgi:GNAT superfamily N-acetyltransferase
MLTLRPAEPQDTPLILAYVRELALYEQTPELAIASEADMRKAIFGPRPLAWAIMAEWEGRPAGFALWFYVFSTWEGKPGLYLEDLFVRPEFRGHGIGKALLKRVAAIALEQGCSRYQWSVLDWNQPSIDFYESQGARVMREWLLCRVEGEALVRLAQNGG